MWKRVIPWERIFLIWLCLLVAGAAFLLYWVFR